MKILVCVKAVPDNDNITAKSDGSISIGGEYSVGEYDYNAIEAAVRLKELVADSTVTILSVCADECCVTSKIRKAVLSRGADDFYCVVDSAIKGADTFFVASVLKKTVNKLGDFDLVLCGEGSGDMYSQQTGNTLGALLGWNTINAVSNLSYEPGCLKVMRALENFSEEYDIDFPAVITVTSDINTPRIASLKEIMAAGRKPSTQWSLSDVEIQADPGIEIVSTLAPTQKKRKCELFVGDDQTAVSTLFEHIRKII